MALFQIQKGKASTLATKRPNTTEGYCYFTTDDGKFYIDIATATGVANRVVLNAYKADILRTARNLQVDLESTSYVSFDGSVDRKNIGVSGILKVANGGTGKSSHTANAVLTGNGTSAVQNVATASGALYATTANGAPKFGTLPIAQGGTGLTANPSMLINLASNSAANVLAASPRPGVTGTLAVGNGGTGKTSWTANALIYAATTTSLGQIDLGTSGYVLQSNGSANAPSWVNATSSNTASTIVKRDSSGNFNAGKITATLNYITGNHMGFISGGETDKFFDFAYGADPTATTAPGASWRIGALNSGSSDSNYFVIQTGGSDTSATIWNNALRIGMNTLDIAVGGNLYPLTNNSKTLGTSSYKWSGVYATTFYGALSGNATTATSAGAFTSAASVTLTGDVTGTASSTKGWSVATTLANSGVTAGSYGPSANASPAHGGTFSVPYITFDAKGRATAASTKTITLPTYTIGNATITIAAGTGLTTGGSFTTNQTSAGTITLNHSNSITAGSVGSAQSPSHGGTFAIPKITYDAQGHITGATTVNITLPADNNTDTKVTQTARTTNGSFPILVRGDAAGTSTVTTTTSFRTNTSINLSTGLITEAGVEMQRKYGTLIPYGTNIPANANLNTTAYLKVGNYYQGANANVATFTNCPTTSAFMMQVLSPLSTTIDNEATGTWVYRLRILQTYTGPRYVQYVYSGSTAGTFTYGAWTRTVECEADGAVGGTTTPVYISGGQTVAGTSYAKAIKSITRSGTTFTYTCIDGTTGTFSQQDSNTTYGAGTGLSLSGTTFSTKLKSTTSLGTIGTTSKLYAVGVDANGQLCVNVPWTDNNTTYTFTNKAATLSWGTAVTVATVGGTDITVKLPSNPNTNTAHAHTAGNGITLTGSGGTSGTTTIALSDSFTVSGTITAGKVVGAVWNDYAEYRWVLKNPDTDEPIEAGRCVAENGNDSMSLTHNRLQPGARIISDTYGMCMGETEKAKTPIAVCGRVLAYPFERKVAFNVGDPVCSGPNGTVSKMSREEAMMYPERIVGTVVSKPTYKEWGPNKIPVKGRIWIQVR